MLQSAFIGGYSLSSGVFGYMASVFPRFKVTALGLFIWCAAIVICAMSPNYYVLLAGRVLSGVGEASFQAVIPPWIQDNAPKDKTGRM